VNSSRRQLSRNTWQFKKIGKEKSTSGKISEVVPEYDKQKAYQKQHRWIFNLHCIFRRRIGTVGKSSDDWSSLSINYLSSWFELRESITYFPVTEKSDSAEESVEVRYEDETIWLSQKMMAVRMMRVHGELSWNTSVPPFSSVWQPPRKGTWMSILTPTNRPVSIDLSISRCKVSWWCSEISEY